MFPSNSSQNCKSIHKILMTMQNIYIYNMILNLKKSTWDMSINNLSLIYFVFQTWKNLCWNLANISCGVIKVSLCEEIMGHFLIFSYIFKFLIITW